MLPVTHGDRFTRLHILLYTVLLSAISLMPFLIGMSGLIYLVGALLLSGGFLICRLLCSSQVKQVCLAYFSLLDRLPWFVIFVFGRGSLLPFWLMTSER